jgi:hypothetical protein
MPNDSSIKLFSTDLPIHCFPPFHPAFFKPVKYRQKLFIRH